MARVGGYFRSAFNALVAARQLQAARYVNGALLMHDDESLRALGYDRKELQRRSSAFPY